MKKLILGIITVLSLGMIGYSGGIVFNSVKGNLDKSSLEKDIKKLDESIKEKSTLLAEVKAKDTELRKHYNQIRQEKGIKVVYLTFDDGPTPNNTPRILEILKKNNIKATFFVIGQNPDMYKQIVDQGHAIAIHTYSHEYKQVYIN